MIRFLEKENKVEVMIQGKGKSFTNFVTSPSLIF